MKSVCKTNVRKALREAYDTDAKASVNIDWDVWFGPNYGSIFCDCSVSMEHRITGERISFSVGGCTTKTELIDLCTETLMRQWGGREKGMGDYVLVFKNLKTGEYINVRMRAEYHMRRYEFDKFKELAFKAFKIQNPLELMSDYALVKSWAM